MAEAEDHPHSGLLREPRLRGLCQTGTIRGRGRPTPKGAARLAGRKGPCSAIQAGATKASAGVLAESAVLADELDGSVGGGVAVVGVVVEAVAVIAVLVAAVAVAVAAPPGGAGQTHGPDARPSRGRDEAAGLPHRPRVAARQQAVHGREGTALVGEGARTDSAALQQADGGAYADALTRWRTLGAVAAIAPTLCPTREAMAPELGARSAARAPPTAEWQGWRGSW